MTKSCSHFNSSQPPTSYTWPTWLNNPGQNSPHPAVEGSPTLDLNPHQAAGLGYTLNIYIVYIDIYISTAYTLNKQMGFPARTTDRSGKNIKGKAVGCGPQNPRRVTGDS